MTQAQVANVVLLTWISNTFARSSSKRAIAIGFMNSIGTSGNILSPSVALSVFLVVANGAHTTPQVHMGIKPGPDIYGVLPHLHRAGQRMYFILLGI
jgi:hypothetical protein